MRRGSGRSRTVPSGQGRSLRLGESLRGRSGAYCRHRHVDFLQQRAAGGGPAAGLSLAARPAPNCPAAIQTA